MKKRTKAVTGRATVAPSYNSKPMEEHTSFDDWEVRDALQAIVRADKIRANKALMKAVLAEAAKQLKSAQQTVSKLTTGGR